MLIWLLQPLRNVVAHGEALAQENASKQMQDVAVEPSELGRAPRPKHFLRDSILAQVV
jgi:hypothetical protein